MRSYQSWIVGECQKKYIYISQLKAVVVPDINVGHNLHWSSISTPLAAVTGHVLLFYQLQLLRKKVTCMLSFQKYKYAESVVRVTKNRALDVIDASLDILILQDTSKGTEIADENEAYQEY